MMSNQDTTLESIANIDPSSSLDGKHEAQKKAQMTVSKVAIRIQGQVSRQIVETFSKRTQVYASATIIPCVVVLSA